MDVSRHILVLDTSIFINFFDKYFGTEGVRISWNRSSMWLVSDAAFWLQLGCVAAASVLVTVIQCYVVRISWNRSSM